MTDLPDPLDELASAHLDGATTPEEDARLADDPQLQARVEALRAVRAAVGDVPAVGDEERATTVAAVLARLDQGATVTPLAPVARHRAPRGWRIAAAAAAVAAVAVLIPLLVRQDDSSTQDAASGAADTTAARNEDAAAPEAEAGSGAAPPSTTVSSRALDAADLADLGDFATVAALEAALDGPRETAAFGTDSAGSTADAPPACDAASSAKRASVVAGRARVADRPVIVVLYDDDARLLLLDATSCAVVADVSR